MGTWGEVQRPIVCGACSAEDRRAGFLCVGVILKGISLGDNRMCFLTSPSNAN